MTAKKLVAVLQRRRISKGLPERTLLTLLRGQLFTDVDENDLKDVKENHYCLLLN